MKLPRLLAETPSAGKRSLADLFAWLLNGAIVAGLSALVLDRTVPPQHLPWTPLRLDQPPGLFTGPKLLVAKADPARCRRLMTDAGVRLSEAPTISSGFCTTADSVRLTRGVTPLAPAGPTMTCGLALQYALWERHVVQPAARDLLGSPVARVEHFGTYSCRRIYGRSEGAVSQHARAAALDVAAFTLADGRRITVLNGWRGDGAEAAFLRRARDGACPLFGGVLSPDYNAAHADHLHLDDGPWQACR